MNNDNDNENKKNNSINDFLNSYITLNEILKPNLSEKKQNFLQLFIKILTLQINSFSFFLLTDENQKQNNIIQDNILNLSKELSKLLFYIKENDILLMYNNVINFSIISTKRKLSTPSLQINKKNILSNNINHFSNRINKINDNNNKQENNIVKPKKVKNVNSLLDNKTIQSSEKNMKNNKINTKNEIKEEIKTTKKNRKANILLNSVEKKTNNYYMSLNNSIEKIKFSTNNNDNNNKGEYRSKSNIKGKSNEILLLDNEKMGIKAYEEKTNKPSNYARHLVEKYKDVVDNYEKMDIDKENNFSKTYNKNNSLKKKNNNKN